MWIARQAACLEPSQNVVRSSRGGSPARRLLVASVSLAVSVWATAGTAFAQFAQEPGATTDENAEKAPDAEAPEEAPAAAETPTGPAEETRPEQNRAAEGADDERGRAEEGSAEEASVAEETAEEGADDERAARAIYASLDLAFTRGDLGAFSDNTGFDRTAANGFSYGVSAGVRLNQARFGLNWRVHDTTEFDLWSFALSAGYELPLRPVTPIFSAHVGYVFSRSIESALFRSSLPEGTVLPPAVDVKGLLAGIDGTVSFSVAKFFAVGPFVGADLMVLSREQAKVPRTIFGTASEVADLPLYRESGGGLGVNFTVGVRGTFDFAMD